jgi:PST family polysaccharide transporter
VTTYNSRGLAFGATAVGIVNLIKIGLQLLLLPVMARLLGPAAFGLYALALPTVSLVALLADGGFGATLAREPEERVVIWSTAYWFLAGSGVVLAVLVSAWGLALGVMTHQPKLPGLMALLSISFILLTLSISPAARLTRQGRLGPAALADLLSTVVGAVVAVTLAVRGAGAWSLAAQYVAVYLVRLLVVNAFGFAAPGLHFQVQVLREHLAAAGHIIGSRMADFAGRLTENVVIGRFLGTATLGAYTFSNQAPRFLCDAAGNPAWAALYIHALRHPPAEAGALFTKVARLLGLALFPAALIFVAVAPQAVALALGSKWAIAGPLLQILLPSYVVSTIADRNGALLIAYGRADVQLWASGGLAVLRVLVVCAGPWIGWMGIGCGIAGANVLYAGLMLILPARILDGRPLRTLAALAGPALAAAAAALFCVAISSRLPGGLPGAALTVGAGGLAYVVILVLIDRRALTGDLQAVRMLLAGKGRPAPETA